jgi:hypothetical protein
MKLLLIIVLAMVYTLLLLPLVAIVCLRSNCFTEHPKEIKMRQDKLKVPLALDL